MTMSISSAPASTAWRVSSSLTSVKVWPDGKPVATLATLTVEPASACLAIRDDARDRCRSPRRSGWLGSAGRAHALGAQRADLALSVLALERGQIDHPDREVERPQLDSRLIERFLSESTRSSMPTWSTPPTRSTVDSMPSRGRPKRAPVRSPARTAAERRAERLNRGYVSCGRSYALALHLATGAPNSC